MVRVLHVFEFFDQGGIENFVMNVYRCIDRNEIQFDFAFINRSKGFFDEEVKQLGGNIYYFLSERKTIYNYYKSISKIIREHGPYDVVHSHMYYFSGVILGIAKENGVKIRIAHSHETLKGRMPTFKRKAYESIMRHLIKQNATILISCSDIAGSYVFGKDAKYTVLYNGVDVQRFRFDPDRRYTFRQNNGWADKKVILCIGRFADQKNHVFLIDVFEKILLVERNAILVLIGTGALKEKVKHIIENKGLSEKVVILSNIANTEDYYTAADLYMMPSKYEGMSIVSIEAQISGLYCLLSDQIPREIDVSNQISYLPIDNIDIWSKCAIEKLNLKDENSRADSYKLFSNGEFDVRTTVQMISDIYTGKDNQKAERKNSDGRSV